MCHLQKIGVLAAECRTCLSSPRCSNWWMVSTLVIFGCSIEDLNPYSCHNILEHCEDALDLFSISTQGSHLWCLVSRIECWHIVLTRLRLILTLIVTYLCRTRNQHLVVEWIQGEVQKGSIQKVFIVNTSKTYIFGVNPNTCSRMLWPGLGLLSKPDAKKTCLESREHMWEWW